MKIKLMVSMFSLSLGAGVTFADNTNTQPIAIPSIVALPDFSGIYDSVGKSVVNITVTKSVDQTLASSGDPLFDYFLKRMVPPQQQRKLKQRALGSGFIISNDGYILTNAHVVADADEVSVKLNDKREFKARVVGYDTGTDVALIKIEAKNLPLVKIGDSSLMKPGNWVVAIGSPFGLENTITQGTISAMSRNLPDDNYVPYIQTDVPINPGNSGGPLINLHGEVIGINSQIYSKSGGYMGIAFAIPIEYAMSVATQLKATGKVIRGKVGIGVQPLTDDLAKSFGLDSTNGAVVNIVEPSSPADIAGIKVGDIIVKANSKAITDSSMLPRIVGQLGPNKPITFTIWRNGKTLSLTAITVKAEANAQVQPTTSDVNKTIDIKKLGISVATLSDKAMLPPNITFGLVVQNITPDAQMSGLMQGDLIIGVGTHNIDGIGSFNTLIARYPVGSNVPLKILRGDSRQFGTLFIPLKILH